MKKYYILKNNDLGMIQLPSKVWKEAGWDLNEEVELSICETFNDDNEKWFSISIERVQDLDKYVGGWEV